MRPRNFIIVVLFIFAFTGLAACGGGGGGNFVGPPAPVPSATPNPTPTVPAPSPTPATGSASIGNSGGTISVTVGKSTVKLTVPAGALSTSATVKFTAYLSDSAVQPFARRARMAASAGTFLAGFTVDAGGAVLYAPLQVSFSGMTPPAGTLARLAMYGSKSNAYTDVDTATVNGSALVNESNASYVGISTAGASNPYAFYAVAPSATQTPPPITLTATTTTAQPFPIQTAVTLTGSGADANGNRDAFIPTYALQNATVGTLNVQSAPPYQATLTTGNTSATASLTVSDAVRKTSGTVTVNVGSERPANNGDSYTYTGTWSQTFDRTGQTPVTTTAALNDAVAVTSGATFNSLTGLYDFKSTETSTSNLTTATMRTDAYDAYNASASPITFAAYGFAFDDGAGNTSTTTYADPQLVDKLPEQSGASWTNDGAATTVENDASGDTATTTYAADGTYTETQVFTASSIYPNSQAVFTESGDGSGKIALRAYGFPYQVVYTAPSAGSIAATVEDTATPPNVFYTQQVNAWFTSPPGFYTETDADMGAALLPQGCAVGASIGTSANKLEQVITRLDTIAGFTETTTTDTYVAPGFGAVCMTIADVLNNYYNLQGDLNSSLGLGFNSTAYQITTTSETLALQSASVVGAARTRSASAIAAAAPPAALRAARVAFDQRLRAIRQQYVRGLIKTMHAIRKGAVR